MQVDKSTVLLMTDEQLSSLGISTIGDCLRLKVFCSGPASTSTTNIQNPPSRKTGITESERQAKIERVKEILNQKKRVKRDNVQGTSAVCTQKGRQKETLKIDFGWKHWLNGKYKQKRSDAGGGKRRIDVHRSAGYDDCLKITKKLFFPKGLSSEGHEDDMYFSLGNYGGVILHDLEVEYDIVPFSVEKYKEVTGFALPSLFLLSRRRNYVDDDDSDDDLTPVFESTCVENVKLVNLQAESFSEDKAKQSAKESVVRIQEIVQEEEEVEALEMWRSTSHFHNWLPADTSEEIFQSSTLIGSSSERTAFFEELQQQLDDSSAIDNAKQKAKEDEEKERRARIDKEILQAKEEADALEELRKIRESRVPPERSDNGIRVLICHVNMGLLTRTFPSSVTMSAVYYWIGSLSPTPKNFRLSKMPNITLYPDASVASADKELLSITEISDPLPLETDANEVAFYEGQRPDLFSSEETLMDISAQASRSSA